MNHINIENIPSDFVDSNDDSWHVEDKEHKNKDATDPSKRKVIGPPKYTHIIIIRIGLC